MTQDVEPVCLNRISMILKDNSVTVLKPGVTELLKQIVGERTTTYNQIVGER